MNNRFNSEKAAEADNYLRTYKNTKEIIVAKEEEISRLQYHIAKIPQDSSNFLQMQSELAECKRILEAQILVLRGELIKVGEVIDKIDNSRYRAVLELLYINGKRLYGRVRVVSSMADFKVEVVSSGADLKVEQVNMFSDSCGKWEFADMFSDFTVEFVNVNSDFKIEFVNMFPGVQ